MTTEEAFEIFINDPLLVKTTGMSNEYKRLLRKKLKDGGLKHDTMQEWLLKADFKEKIDWRLPRGYIKKTAVDTAVSE